MLNKRDEGKVAPTPGMPDRTISGEGLRMKSSAADALPRLQPKDATAALVIIVVLLIPRVVLYDCINSDDPAWILENSYVLSGLILSSIKWAAAGRFTEAVAAVESAIVAVRETGEWTGRHEKHLHLFKNNKPLVSE